MRVVAAFWFAALTPGLLALDLRVEPTENALRTALTRVASAGGGKITFGASNAVVDVKDRIELRGNGVVLDGETRNITFRYTGPDDCSQKEGQDPLIEIHGDRNVIRNFTLERFPDGIHVLSGRDNLIENIRFPKVCEDAITNNGRGFQAFGTVIRNCYFQNSEDKAVMINNGGSVTVESCEFVNCTQPVRAGGRSGRHIVRKCVFKGRSTGPRFNGGADGMFVRFENNIVEGATYGLRVYGNAEAIILNNRIRPRPGTGYGIYIYENARARLSGNDVEGAAQGGVVVQGNAQADLGGGRVQIGGTSEPSNGSNRLVANEPADLINETPARISAKNNIWDHSTASEVLAADVRGAADVGPVGQIKRTRVRRD